MNGLDYLGHEDEQLHAAVHHLVDKAVRLAGGSVPPVGSWQWWDAPPMAKLAGLLVLAEARLIDDPDALAAQQLKAASVAISDGKDWSAFANLPSFGSHAVVAARRREPGPLAGLVFDPVAARRWVETGSSEEAAA